MPFNPAIQMESIEYMKKAPIIIMQLVHIQGPMKGQIQEFSEPEISIGRHPSCHVQFPKDLSLISRQHARIVREGNRFKLVDQSANGTFLNGKQVQESYLKDGDILLFADGGPKVSFLTKLGESPADLPQVAKIPAVQMAPPRPSQPQTPPPPLSLPPEVPAAEMKIERTQMPLIIQYGPTLRTFKELPVTIGRNPACDFSIDHPGLLERHAQFIFSQGQYGIQDLTGKNQVTIDGSPVNFQAALHPECRVSLSSSGPSFRFLGAGRLAEIEESPPPETDIPSPAPEAPSLPKKKTTGTPTKTAKKIIDKFFKS
jgi:pSer/pThr/pTyr-binding forkhead associated (FHA) protein